MRPFLLDTNVCIAILNGTSSRVAEAFTCESPQTIRMCSIVVAELLYGAEKSNNRSRTRARVERFLGPFASLPFDDKCAAEYGIIRASLERQGRPIGGNDLMIAAIARRHDVVLVSHNQREFERVAGLRLEDWQAPA